MSLYNPEVTVIYIARGLDWGIDAPKKFLESYKKFTAGYEHNLIIAAKGWETKQEEYTKLKELAEENSAQIIELPDDGLDFGAYYRTAIQIKSNYILCLATSCKIMCDNWILKAMKAKQEHPKMELISYGGNWEECISYYDFFNNLLKNQCKSKNLTYHLKKNYYRIINFVKFCNILGGWDRKYPNYSVRTHAFLINRKLYVEYMNKTGQPKNKYDTYQIENGKNNISKYIEGKGYKFGVVGRNGKFYFKEEFNKSGTYRSDFKNYIIEDKQIRIYNELSEDNKKFLYKKTWENS